MKMHVSEEWCRTMAKKEEGHEVGAGLMACFCIGPQNGEPLCPCRMRGVIIRDGRYILPEKDLGPVASVAALQEGS